jgi:hypothetical protein
MARSKFLPAAIALGAAVSFPVQVEAQVGGGTKGGGLLGQYFNNPDLAGSPAFSRRDVRVDFDWGSLIKPGGSLRQAGFRDLGADNYSVRWTGQILSRFSETYTFKVTADDGARLFIRPAGGEAAAVIDAWNAPATTTGTFALKKGVAYDIKLEYRETTGTARCVLKWSSRSTPEEVIEPLTPAGINAETHKNEWFTDKVKVARDSYMGTDYNDPKTWPARDANGWPRGDFTQILWEGRPSSETGGAYLLKFKGKAEVNGSFGDAKFRVGSTDYGQGKPLPAGAGYDEKTNTTTAFMDLRPNNIFSLSMSRTQRTAQSAAGTGVTEIQVFMPTVEGGATPYDGTNEWRPDSLALYAPFTTLRMLTANFVTHTSWVAHPDSWTDDHQVQGKGTEQCYPRDTCRVGGNYAQQCSFWALRGFPSWERQVEICNLTGKDLYITINYKADADYVTKLAQLIRYGSDGINPYTSEQANPVFAPLNPNLKVYVEWSNEMWNFAFQQFFDLLTETRAILGNAGHADRPILTYDNIDVAARGDGGYNNEVVIMYRLLALKTAKAGDIFRTVFGEAGGPINRVRPIFMFQYDNGASCVDALQMLDDWFNNADGKKHVANPQPINTYLWGGGGASYYGASNGMGTQNAIVPANPGFEIPAVPEGKSAAAPARAAWKFTGEAGIRRSGGAQTAYITGTGGISQSINFPAAGLYAFKFTVSGDGQKLDVHAGTSKLNPGDAPDNIPLDHQGTPIDCGGTRSTVCTLPIKVSAPGPVTLTVTGLTDGKTALLDDFEIHSANAIFGSTIPYYNANVSHEQLMRAEVNFLKPYGLNMIIYEGGWAVFSDPGGGGSDASTPLGKHIKYNDPRSRVINRENGHQLVRAGGSVYCYGSFGQWSNTHNAPKEPIWQSFVDLADTLPPAVSNGFYIPGTVTPAVRTARRKATDAGVEDRGWTSWNLIAPQTSKYEITVNTPDAGGAVCLQLNGRTVASGPSGTPLTHKADLTTGMHNLTVRSGGGAFAITSVVIAQPGGPGAPSITSISQTGADVALAWNAPAGGPSPEGYIVRYGTAPNTYSSELMLGKTTQCRISGLGHAKDYYFAVVAYGGGASSVASEEKTIFYTAPGKPFWRTLDDRDPAVIYSKDPYWSQFGDGRHFKTTETFTDKAGASATFAFTGVQARFITANRGDRGIAEIFLDGVSVAKVDGSAKGGFQSVGYETPVLPNGPHELKVVVTGTKSENSTGAAVVVDAFSYCDPGTPVRK